MSQNGPATRGTSGTAKLAAAHANGRDAPPADRPQPLLSWQEPPLRQPLASFQDHPGVPRQGVLENMLPLGTYPTTRVKAKSKNEPLRKIIQARNLGANGLVLDEGRSVSPVANVAEHTRGVGLPRARPMHQGPNMIDPALMDFEMFQAGSAMSPPPALNALLQQAQDVDDDQGEQQAAEAAKATVAALDLDFRLDSDGSHAPIPEMPLEGAPNRTSRTPSQSLLGSSTPVQGPPGTYTPSPIQPDSPFFTAVSIANRKGTPEVQQPLAFLYGQTQQDPELARLLDEAAKDTDSPNAQNMVNDPNSELGRRIKHVKKRFRSQSSSSSRVGSSAGANSVLSSVRQAASALASPTKQSNASSLKDAHIHQHLHPSSSASSLAGTAMSLSPGIGDADNSSARRPIRGIYPSKRRGSSSSLSSVDELLAHDDATPSDVYVAPRGAHMRDGTYKRLANAMTYSFRVSPKRSIEVDSVLDEQDAEVELKRRRLRRDFSDLKIKFSNLRSSLATMKMTRLAKATKLGQKVSEPVTEFACWPLGINIKTTDSDDEPPSTPIATARVPSKKKNAPRTKISPVKGANQRPTGSGVVPAELQDTKEARRDGSVEAEGSSNNDFCSACSGPGYLLCCDGCDRSFHFTCLDPPFVQDEHNNSKWFCASCEAQRDPPRHAQQGLFAELHNRVQRRNPSAFELPKYIKTYFTGARTGEDGQYLEVHDQRPVTGGRIGYDDLPDYKKLKDAKGLPILCFSCGKSASGGREIIPCDYCNLNWHLDCLDPPMANPPSRPSASKMRSAWMCPVHVEHELKFIDPMRRRIGSLRPDTKWHRMRQPTKTKVVAVHMRRGFTNNGMIEVESDTDESGFFTDENPEGVTYKLPRKGIKLDFIDKVKQTRLVEDRKRREASTRLALQNQHLEEQLQRKLLSDLEGRRFKERKAALNLTQFRENNQDLNLASNEIENLILMLEAEAPSEVVESIVKQEDEPVTTKSLRSTRSLPSPPASSSTLDSTGPSSREREILTRMQEHIRRLLEASTHG